MVETCSYLYSNWHYMNKTDLTQHKGYNSLRFVQWTISENIKFHGITTVEGFSWLNKHCLMSWHTAVVVATAWWWYAATVTSLWKTVAIDLFCRLAMRMCCKFFVHISQLPFRFHAYMFQETKKKRIFFFSIRGKLILCVLVSLMRDLGEDYCGLFRLKICYDK